MRVAIYTRVSHQYQAEKGSSLTTQEHTVKSFCVFKGWEVIEVYTDAGISGRKFDRPAFNRMIEDLKPKAIDIVVVHSLSRFGRNTRELLKQIEILEKNNVKFYAMDLNIDTGTAHGKMILTVMAAMAQLESDTTSERIRAGMAGRKSRMETYCAIPPLGFKRVKDKLVVEPREMQLVKDIFREYELGLTPYAIAKKFADHPGKKGSPLTATTISKILKNKIYDKQISENERSKFVQR